MKKNGIALIHQSRSAEKMLESVVRNINKILEFS
jgi:predicted component of type VI protein secretion system